MLCRTRVSNFFCICSSQRAHDQPNKAILEAGIEGEMGMRLRKQLQGSVFYQKAIFTAIGMYMNISYWRSRNIRLVRRLLPKNVWTMCLRCCWRRRRFWFAHKRRIMLWYILLKHFIANSSIASEFVKVVLWLLSKMYASLLTIISAPYRIIGLMTIYAMLKLFKLEQSLQISQ